MERFTLVVLAGYAGWGKDWRGGWLPATAMPRRRLAKGPEQHPIYARIQQGGQRGAAVAREPGVLPPEIGLPNLI